MAAFCSDRTTTLLRELRFVAKEVGGLAEAKKLPTVIRHWWISEVLRERSEAGASGSERT